jgi:hypothetical protein
MPGDGRALPRYRWWQLFSRSLFHLCLADDDGMPVTWSVDVRHGGDENGEVFALLYRDGVNQSRSKLPAAFPVPGGRIEVVASAFGLRRCHYVTDDGEERQLVPDRASAEGRRAHLERNNPAASRAIGAVSIVVLVIGLVLGAPQILEQVTAIPPVAETFGTFVSPIHLPAWVNIALLLATVAASTERALRLRYNWLLDGGLYGAEE